MGRPAPRERFLAGKTPFEAARIALFGCPFDATASFRSGARLGPEALRTASDSIETYSPELDADLEDIPFCDLGDLSLPADDTEEALGRVREEGRRLFSLDKIPFALGGEHLLSLPLIEAASEAHPDMVIFQWDAHADLREEYRGAALSHATVMRRAAEAAGSGRLFQFGIRSGTREEWRWMRGRETRRDLTAEEVEAALRKSAGAPIYLTLDLDVLDPGEMPGTGNPEPGGLRFAELSACIHSLKRASAPIVALDVVELAPPCDPGGSSAVVAAKVVRELLLSLPNS